MFVFFVAGIRVTNCIYLNKIEQNRIEQIKLPKVKSLKCLLLDKDRGRTPGIVVGLIVSALQVKIMLTRSLIYFSCFIISKQPVVNML